MLEFETPHHTIESNHTTITGKLLMVVFVTSNVIHRFLFLFVCFLSLSNSLLLVQL